MFSNLLFKGVAWRMAAGRLADTAISLQLTAISFGFRILLFKGVVAAGLGVCWVVGQVIMIGFQNEFIISGYHDAGFHRNQTQSLRPGYKDSMSVRQFAY